MPRSMWNDVFSMVLNAAKKAKRTYVLPRPADDLLELLPLATAVLVQLLEVLDALLGLWNNGLLEVGGFPEELLGGDLGEWERCKSALLRVETVGREGAYLHRRRCAVLDPSSAFTTRHCWGEMRRGETRSGGEGRGRGKLEGAGEVL